MADRAGPLRPTGERFRPPAWGLLLVLAGLEIAWFAWFESVRLTNCGGIGRWVFLARAFPQVVPGVTFGRSYLGIALAELSHVENLPQRLPIVLAAGLIAAAALGLGDLVLRGLGLVARLSNAERWGAAFGLGASSLGAIALILGRLGWLSPGPVRFGLAAIAAADAVWLIVERRRGTRGTLEIRGEGWLGWGGFVALSGPFALLMALGAMEPAIEFDALEYHLQGPKEYYQAGRISFLPYNVYTNMPFNVEMLHLLGMNVLDDWWWGALTGQLLVASFAAMSAVMIAVVARRVGSPRAAWFAAMVYLTTPWVYRVAAHPFVEGPLCYYHAALVWAALRAWTEPMPRLRTRFWALAGLFAGGAMACKYPALVSAVIPAGMVALVDAIRRRRPSAVLAFALGTVVLASPWLARNAIDTGNPVYPLAYRVFGGRHWDAARDERWSHAHGPRPIEAGLLWEAVLNIAGRSDWQSPLFVALSPLAFLRRGSRRGAVVLGGYAAFLFLTWWLLTHRLDRFWLPMLVPLAILAGLGADWTRDKGWLALLGSILAVSIVANLSFSSTPLTALTDWTGNLTALRRSVPARLNAPLASVDARLSAGSRLLLVGPAAVFHVNHPIVYNTVFNDETFETLTKGRQPDEVRAALTRLGITHIYVDWQEIERYRSPGNYGFTPFVIPDEFERLVKSGVLEPAVTVAEKRELYRVR